MAKRSKKSSLTHRLCQAVFRFFVPRKVRSVAGGIWFGLSRIGAIFGTFFVLSTFLFAVLPVPFSAYMVQKKVENWVQGKTYSVKYQWVSLDRIAWQMQMAVIAGEDQKFESHFGIDLKAIEIAIQRNAKSKKVRGASTISQQTVKNLYLWQGTSWLRKGIELPLTFLIENVWDKQRILEVYLNIAEFGNGIFGVEAAARHFFNKSAKDLNLQESALLAASLPNPIAFPVNRPGPTMRKRQEWIMSQVQALGGKNYLDKL